MTSQDVGVERESTTTSSSLGLQLFDGRSCCEQLNNSVNSHPLPVSQGFNHGTVESTIDPASRCSINYSCTPHSIDDILSRPRRVHVTSLLLPELRRTSGSVTQDRLYCWSMRSSEDVHRLDQRTGEDELTWKTRYWTEHSPGSTTTPTKRGMRGTI